MPVPRAHDDDLDELPPLDGDATDEPSPEPEADDALADDAGVANLDDSTGEDDPADPGDLDLEHVEGGWLNEPADTPDLDLGDVSIVDFSEGASPTEDVDEPGVGDEDFGLGGASEHGGLDAGDEGPLDGDEELREGDLPRLDADEEGDVDDASLIDSGFAADAPVGLPWAAAPWSRVGAPVALTAATTVACAPGGAVAVGRGESGALELVRIDLEGTSQTLAALGLDLARVRLVAARGRRVAALVEGGQLWLSADEGARFAAVAAGAVTEAGPANAGGAPGATAADLEVLVAGVAHGAGVPVTREAEPPEARAPAIAASRGSCVAYAARRGGVVQRRADGRWEPIAWEGQVLALAYLDDAGTLVAATYADADDTTALVRVDVQGRAAVVARIGAAGSDGDADGRAVALAYDEARAVVWVAGGFGVAAFAVR